VFTLKGMPGRPASLAAVRLANSSALRLRGERVGFLLSRFILSFRVRQSGGSFAEAIGSAVRHDKDDKEEL